MRITEKISKERLLEIIRFCIVGTLAVAIQYSTYYFMLTSLGHNFAFVLSYLISFAFNFILTVYFTFESKPNIKKGYGFIFSHLVNFSLQWVLLIFFIYIGMEKRIAILPVFAICVPINYLLVRYFIKDTNNTTSSKV